MTMRRRLFVSFGIGVVLMFGVAGLRSIARAQAPAAPVEPAATTAPPPAPEPVAAAPVGVPDPTGDNTGTASDVTVKDAKNPTLNEVMATVGHNKIAINIVWTLLTGFLVMFMQAGFALVETGFCRAKNAAHTMAMNFMIYPIGMMGYWICGFALQMGGVGAVGEVEWHGGYRQDFPIAVVDHLDDSHRKARPDEVVRPAEKTLRP